MDKIIYGDVIAQNIKDSIKARIDTIKEKGQRLPKLVVVVVGSKVASQSYIRGKEKACQAIGMENDLIQLDDAITQQELLRVIQQLNHDDTVDGILIQMPLPKHIQENEILFAIDPNKDVDGFHPFNVGKMMIQEKTFIPCTPKGIMTILKHIGYEDLSGLRAVILGRSNVVGRPVSQLLLNQHATVTVCHTRTEDVAKEAANADILIAAAGQPRMVKADWVKNGAVVIDVGVNRDECGKLCGDVDLDEVIARCRYITPVPKGVGPMTIAMLLENTLEAYDLHMEKEG
ncbi:MAG: bifunctional methylenetetrahydrofolate dehydrogenase/methenyltetrahydrofolate cyclohydrolase FolD [Erysipelotrichaceae bacterium]|nr:bifunctional methylenetetrahydrofolate dehydrogenase/methenyltetrahydrofolate cyclohydrolase FolD [Erysipelotrichaceae bacterium]